MMKTAPKVPEIKGLPAPTRHWEDQRANFWGYHAYTVDNNKMYIGKFLKSEPTERDMDEINLDIKKHLFLNEFHDDGLIDPKWEPDEEFYTNKGKYLEEVKKFSKNND